MLLLLLLLLLLTSSLTPEVFREVFTCSLTPEVFNLPTPPHSLKLSLLLMLSKLALRGFCCCCCCRRGVEGGEASPGPLPFMRFWEADTARPLSYSPKGARYGESLLFSPPFLPLPPPPPPPPPPPRVTLPTPFTPPLPSPPARGEVQEGEERRLFFGERGLGALPKGEPMRPPP